MWQNVDKTILAIKLKWKYSLKLYMCKTNYQLDSVNKNNRDMSINTVHSETIGTVKPIKLFLL